jgi:hypothetical protein
VVLMPLATLTLILPTYSAAGLARLTGVLKVRPQGPGLDAPLSPSG